MQVPLRHYPTPVVMLAYALGAMEDEAEKAANKQKEWFSRAFLVAVAAAAKFPVELTLNDVDGVDATVRDGGITTDWQLKGTSSPDWSKDKKILYFDLDVRTYKLFTGERNSSAYLGVVVMPEADTHWADVSEKELRLRHCGYWQKITGLAPTENVESVRIHLPISQRLDISQIAQIMSAERERISA